MDYQRIFLHSWRPYVWLSALVVVVYGHTILFKEFTYLDDYYIIVDYYNLLTNPEHFIKAFQEDVFHNHQGGIFYRPLLTISFMIDANLGGTDPALYHLSNILYHLIATIILLLLLTELGLSKPFAFCSSLIFSIHPAMT